MESRFFQGAVRTLLRITSCYKSMDSAQPGMNAAQEFVVVKAPLERVYEQWSRIEDPPKFIPPLRGVRRIDDTHFSYVWHPRSERETEVILKIRSIFDPSNLSRRVEEYLGNFKRLVETTEGRE